MRVVVTLLLILCLVLSMSTPVSADYFWYKDVSADDFTNALVDYCNGNTVHNMTGYEFELSGHEFRSYKVVRTPKTLDFKVECKDDYYTFINCPLFPFIPTLEDYCFSGSMHVNNPQDGLKKPYTLTITDEDTKFIAVGGKWRLEVVDVYNTRFKV